MVVQWLGLHIFTAEGIGSIHGQGSDHKLCGMGKKIAPGTWAQLCTAKEILGELRQLNRKFSTHFIPQHHSQRTVKDLGKNI